MPPSSLPERLRTRLHPAPRRARPRAATRVRGALELVRPANLATAAADVAAGWAVATGAQGPLAPLAMGACASVLLYAGGVALNDWCDRRRDAAERPERPLPRGALDPRAALALAAALLAGGVGLAALAGPLAGLVAFAIACVAVAYDAAFKDRALAGPAAMGSARALNLLLGLALAGAAGLAWWPLALPALAHVALLTAAARGEAGRGSGGAVRALLAADGAIAIGLAAWALAAGQPLALPFAAAFGASALLAWAPALRSPAPGPAEVRRGVQGGVLGLVLLDAALAALALPLAGLLVASLLVPARLLARIFPVA